MKNRYFIIFILFFISYPLIINAQTTSIPDSNFEQALIDLNIDSDGIINGEVLNSDISDITYLDISYYEITSLEGIQNFSSLFSLDCDNNNLVTLNLYQNNSLNTLYCRYNNLNELILNDSIRYLRCDYNNLGSLDLSTTTEIIEIFAKFNSFNALDLTETINLKELSLGNNSLESIHVSHISSLERIWVDNNLIESIDLSQNPSLDLVIANSNPNLLELNIKNGNNTAINEVLFRIADNPQLYCVQVDDADWSATNWPNVDNHTNYSENCSYSNEIIFNPNLTYGEFTDARDGKIYKTIEIGNQIWMAENLAYLPSVSPYDSGASYDPHYYVYDYEGTDITAAKSTENYSTYGVLYNWGAFIGYDTASGEANGIQGVCPNGWHIPSWSEWNELFDFVFPLSDLHLKETGTTHWSSTNSGVDNSSGFTALPGGVLKTFSLGADEMYDKGNWWTRDEYAFYLGAQTGIAYEEAATKTWGRSCRCLSDGSTLNYESFEYNKVNTYPNPVNKILNISVNFLSSYKLVDISGKEVLYGELLNGNNQLDINDLNSGFYFLRVNNPYGTIIKKIIKE